MLRSPYSIHLSYATLLYLCCIHLLYTKIFFYSSTQLICIRFRICQRFCNYFANIIFCSIVRANIFDIDHINTAIIVVNRTSALHFHKCIPVYIHAKIIDFVFYKFPCIHCFYQYLSFSKFQFTTLISVHNYDNNCVYRHLQSKQTLCNSDNNKPYLFQLFP